MRAISKSIVALALLAGPWIGSRAATITNDLTGTPQPMVSGPYQYANGDVGTFSSQSNYLIDAATGVATEYAPALNVGDSLGATITETEPLTILGNSQNAGVILNLFNAQNGVTVTGPLSLTFYNNGVAVSPPTGWTVLTPQSQPVNGFDAIFSSSGDSANFIFNQIVWSSIVSSILDCTSGYCNNVESTQLIAPGGMSVQTYAYSNPVPLPASAWLMLSALGGLGFIVKSRNT